MCDAGRALASNRCNKSWAPVVCCGVGGRARFAVARDVKVDPLACFCATPSKIGPQRAELSMAKNARRCPRGRTLGEGKVRARNRDARAFTAPSDAFLTS